MMSESQSPEPEGRQRRVGRLRMEGKLSVPLLSMEAYQVPGPRISTGNEICSWKSENSESCRRQM